MAPTIRGKGVCIMPNTMNSIPGTQIMEEEIGVCKLSSDLDTYTTV